VLSAKAAKSAKLIPDAAMILARLSVEGQRGRGGCSFDSRLDRLKLVASSPAILAKDDGDMASRAAKASIAPQIWACDRALMTGSGAVGAKTVPLKTNSLTGQKR
jgi:hypothetical protein